MKKILTAALVCTLLCSVPASAQEAGPAFDEALSGQQSEEATRSARSDSSGPAWEEGADSGQAADRSEETGAQSGQGADGSGNVGSARSEETTAESRQGSDGDAVTLLAVGDNLIHKALYEHQYDAATGTYDFNICYDLLRDTIASHDIAVINQETIYVSDPALYSDYPTFGTPYAVGDAVVNAGFNVVLSASNHTMDKGLRGITDTLSYWSVHHPEVQLLGLHDSPEDAASIDYREVKGIRFALFNYTYGLNGFSLPAGQSYRVDLLADQGKFLQDVRTAENTADFTICFLHIGEEYQHSPSAYQVNYVNTLIDAGADLIICAHPHVIQPCGMVTTQAGNSALVYYSCGNFLSSQTSLHKLLGGMADVTIARDESGRVGITQYDFIPVVSQFGIRPYYQVVPLTEYTDELAGEHHVYANEGPFTTQSLWEIWNRYSR